LPDHGRQVAFFVAVQKIPEMKTNSGYYFFLFPFLCAGEGQRRAGYNAQKKEGILDVP
jgi:hypothetical protein